MAGSVGEAPPVYNPVELLPSPELLNKSNFIATLFPIPEYPKPPPSGPTAVRPAFCKTKEAVGVRSDQLECEVGSEGLHVYGSGPVSTARLGAGSVRELHGL